MEQTQDRNYKDSSDKRNYKDSSESYKVRLPHPEDFEELIKIARSVHEEGGLMPFDFEKSSAMIYAAISGSPLMIAGVIGPIGKPEAVIAMLIGNFWYSKEYHLEELLNYVKPEFRKSSRAKSLIEYAKKCADETNVPLLIGVLSNKRTEAKIRLYQRQLNKPVGAYFLYTPEKFTREKGWQTTGNYGPDFGH